MADASSMSPRAGLVVASALVAMALAIVAYGLVVAMSGAQWMWASLKPLLAIAPAAAASAGLAAWWVGGWHAGDTTGKPPLRMAFRIVALAFVQFPVFVLAGLLVSQLLDQVFAAQSLGFREAWPLLSAIAVYALMLGVLLGALPAMAIELFICRRYLRQTAATVRGGK
ncbi:hypothetical protein IP90_02813 [Luteimonas cucumeris]|uniref:Uncharacterized protein n=1 Tax=Luteimonas cucumeris TaxID=985012 RepID=A0A562KY34_9GAMM|nr:hypothetical protein [Luteimonas cucumeris]TWI00267.1 hypothetical protein IP90_02813 [Luteimonas cucumeris]